MLVCLTCCSEYEYYGQRRKICRPCKRQYDREYHAKRSTEVKQQKLENQKDRVRIARQYVYDYFKQNPCVNCGESDPVVLEFDHTDQSEKTNVISNMMDSSLVRIKKEIDKCRVLCANCHRRHTSTQLEWYKDLTR